MATPNFENRTLFHRDNLLNTPHRDGGINHISNRVPCNQLKSNVYTLSGLRHENAKHGYMAGG